MKATEIIYKLREAADILESLPHLGGGEVEQAIVHIENAIEEAENMEGAE